MIGLRELAILAAVVLVLYGRSGVLKSRQFQTIWPWISPQRRASKMIGVVRAATVSRPNSTMASVRPGPARRARHFLLEGNRLFWFLTILAATAIAAVILGRMIIASGAGSGLAH
jgi:hypothetical protein